MAGTNVCRGRGVIKTNNDEHRRGEGVENQEI